MQEIYAELETKTKQIEEWERKWQKRWENEGFKVVKSQDIKNFKFIELYNEKEEILREIGMDKSSQNLAEFELTKEGKTYYKIYDSEGKIIMFEDIKGLKAAGFNTSGEAEIFLEKAEEILEKMRPDIIKKYLPEWRG